jgi:hypothetical protein
MVGRPAQGYGFAMTTISGSIEGLAGSVDVKGSDGRSEAEPGASHMSARVRRTAMIAGVLLAVFGGFSTWVVITQGYFGFLSLAGRERWALQMLIDLVIALTIATSWMMADARKRRIASWPYVVATLALGSLGVLAYCARRAFAPLTPPPGT